MRQAAAVRKTVLILLVGVGALALIGLYDGHHRQPYELSAGRAVPAPVVEPRGAVPVAGAGIVSRGRNGKEEPLTAAAEKGDGQAMSQVSTPLVGAKSVSTNESAMAGAIAEMMNKPGMKGMIRELRKSQIDQSHGSLFKYLQLSEADLETFKGALLDREMAKEDIMMDMTKDFRSGAMTREKMRAADERIKEATAGYDARIKALLGDENYALYQSFEETEPEREEVKRFKGELNSADQLTDEQEHNLIRAMYDARTNSTSAVKGSWDKESPAPLQLTPDKIKTFLEENARQQEQYVSRAAAILAPSQLERFKEIQKQQQAMLETALKEGAKMIGQ